MPARDADTGAAAPAWNPQTPPRPTVSPLAEWAVEKAFAGLARLRKGRGFHPRGAGFEGRIRATGSGAGLPFVPNGEYPALIRLSKGAGLPPRVPDIYGVSFRIPDACGPGAHQDLLLASSGERPVLRHALAPTTRFDHRQFSSLLVYRFQGRLTVFGARYVGPRRLRALRLDAVDEAVTEGGVTFELSTAGLTGPWRPFAELRLDRQLPAAQSERLRFHPWNTCDALRPVGPLSVLRAPAYEASQRTATSE